MEIDVEKLTKIISELPDPNTYCYNNYKVITDDVALNKSEIIFSRYNFTDGNKKWVLTLNE